MGCMFSSSRVSDDLFWLLRAPTPTCTKLHTDTHEYTSLKILKIYLKKSPHNLVKCVWRGLGTTINCRLQKKRQFYTFKLKKNLRRQ